MSENETITIHYFIAMSRGSGRMVLLYHNSFLFLLLLKCGLVFFFIIIFACLELRHSIGVCVCV